VRDVHQHLGGHVLRRAVTRAATHQRTRAHREGLLHLRAHHGGVAGTHQGPEVGAGLARVTQVQGTRLGHGGLEERGHHALVHVDALYRAAGLPRVVHGAVDDVGGGLDHVGVLADVGRVLTAQLVAHGDEAPCRGVRDGPAPFHRAGEGHGAHARVPHRVGRERVRHVHVLQEARRQPRLQRALAHALGHQRRLLGVLQQHRVAGQERRHHRVHRGEPGVVPRRQHQHHAHRHALDRAREACLGRQYVVAQGFLREPRHGPPAVQEAAQLTGRLGARPAHLRGELLSRFVADALHHVEEAQHAVDALGEGRVAPGALRRGGPRQQGVQLGRVRERPLVDHGVVGGGDHGEVRAARHGRIGSHAGLAVKAGEPLS
jgi:hypothetical protein